MLGLLNGCSCSDEDKEPLYSKIDIMVKVIKADPNAREVLPDTMDQGIHCSDYGPGCVRGYTAQVVGYKMIFVEFKTVKQARNEALRVNQFFSRNWLFDDVRGEPPLEKFFKQVFEAKNPSEKKDGGL